MNENFKIMINGQEIKLPFDFEEIFNQMVSQQISKPKKIFQQPIQQHVLRRIVECKDTEVRNVVIDMNKRLMELEKMIGKKKIKKSPEDKPKTTPKTKSKKVDKTKSPSKLKKNEKKGSKKVGKKSKK